MKYTTVVSLLLILLSSCATSSNLGHRLGADVLTHLPENSIEALKEALATLQYNKKFEYLEFDVRETSTGELIVFHDSSLKRMTNSKNSASVENSTFSDIRQLCLKNSPKGLCYQIPTPNEVLNVISNAGASKPVLIDIKNISTEGKNKLLATVDKFKNDLSINFIMSKRGFSKLFTQQWCDEFRTRGYVVMQTRKPKIPEVNDLCHTIRNRS